MSAKGDFGRRSTRTSLLQSKQNRDVRVAEKLYLCSNCCPLCCKQTYIERANSKKKKTVFEKAVRFARDTHTHPDFILRVTRVVRYRRHTRLSRSKRRDPIYEMLRASLGDSQQSVDCNLAFSSTWWGGGGGIQRS